VAINQLVKKIIMENSVKKLSKKIIIKGTIEALTGIHIGSSYSAMGIGGPDKTVIRNPLDKLPIIPGSSLKGKMRSLFEKHNGQISGNGGASDSLSHTAVKLFGAASNKDTMPSRLFVRDGKLKNPDLLKDTELLYSETKTEVNINRITAKANPRTFERVPAGAEFELNMILDIFEGEDENELRNSLIEAMRLLKDDYLGGQGSRGYGQVDFRIDSVTERSAEWYRGEGKEKDITETFKL
jgi:CRISPR-associated protein Csm3